MPDAKLADRKAVSEVQLPPATSSQGSLPTPADATPVRSETTSKGRVIPSEASLQQQLAQLRIDLAATQKARVALESRLSNLTATLDSSEQQNKSSTAHTAQLARQKAELERRLRDRDEELREKRKLVEQAQDEQVALGLQLSMAEQKSEKLSKENKELVDRWMKRVGEEAEQVNRDSKYS